MRLQRYLLFFFIILTAFACTACLPLLLAVRNNNNNNTSVTSTTTGAISGTVALPATTSSTLASIRGAITNYTGFTASLIDSGSTLQTVNIDAAGNFRFNSITPKSGYKIRVVKNRIELLLYTETTFSAGQTLTVVVNTTSTARSLVYETLLSQVSGLTISQVSAASVATLVATIESVLSSATNYFTSTSQTVLNLTDVTAVVASTASSVYQQIQGTTTTTSSTSTTTGARDPATATRQNIDRDGDGVTDSATTYTTTAGYGPFGQELYYLNLSPNGVVASQSLSNTPMKAYYFRVDGTGSDVGNPVVTSIPGGSGYNDFWQKVIVNVTSSYIANSLTKVSDILTSRSDVNSMTTTTDLINAPIVAENSTIYSNGSTVTSKTLGTGWYDDKVIKFFTFGSLTTASDGTIPRGRAYLPSSSSSSSQKYCFNYVSGETGYSDLHYGQTLATSTLFTKLSSVFDKIFSEDKKSGVTLSSITNPYYNMPQISVTLPTASTESVTRNGSSSSISYSKTAWELSKGMATETFYIYDFGSYDDGVVASRTSAMVWKFRENGSGDDIGYPVFSAVPGVTGYNDFACEKIVAVPSGYTAGTLRCKNDIDASEYTVNDTGKVVNYPVVPAGSSVDSGTHTLNSGYYGCKNISYFAFGSLSTSEVSTGIWKVDMAPVFVPGTVATQASLVINAPDTTNFSNAGTDEVSGYSDLWMEVTVDAAASITMGAIGSFTDSYIASRTSNGSASQTWDAASTITLTPSSNLDGGGLERNCPSIYSTP
ncbi:hypothetical protein ACFL35_07670 [Candidatus Riflebacteria bacterium]